MSKSTHFFLGLGNPGPNYQRTRHNLGFMMVDYLAEQAEKSTNDFTLSKKGQLEYLWLSNQLELIKPQTYMNQSGLALSYLKKKHPRDFAGLKNTPPALKNLVVAHDDLDLGVGQFKLQFGTGPKGHNGLLSIYQSLGTDQFWHLRLGIDGRQGIRTLPPDQYVLSTFSPTEKEQLQILFPQAQKKLQEIL